MNNKTNILSHTILYFFLVAVIIVFAVNSGKIVSNNKDICIENMRTAIEKTVMQCYASEGSYPADLDYLVKHYGLILDEENYIYDYHVFSSNIMPEINVFENIRKKK